MSIVIATGPLVTVNTIVGLPFIQAIQAIIDLSDNVADLCAFDAPPFPIEYRHATVHVPVIEEGADHPVYLADTKNSIIQEIKDLESYLSNIDIVMDKKSVDRHVLFGSSPGKRFPAPLQVSPNGFVDSPTENYVPGMGLTNNQ